MTIPITTEHYRLSMAEDPGTLWRYDSRAASVPVPPPVFEIDGRACALDALQMEALAPRDVFPGVREYAFRGRPVSVPQVMLTLELRVAEQSPVVRFRYRVQSDESACLTKAGGADAIRYMGLELEANRVVHEVRLSDFDELVHSYRPIEERVPEQAFENGLAVMGPILCATDDASCLLCAYEHGSMAPDRYLEYRLDPEHGASLCAVRGNYPSGWDLRDAYETVWLELAVVPGGMREMADAYRAFVLRWMSPNTESRRPYVFYNTWNYQERHRAWEGGDYLDPIREERMLAEIDVAHRMGVDVFVMDTGWYGKTGDWRVNTAFFPNGLAPLRERLDGYGMRLGLWFSPSHAAVSSTVARSYGDCMVSRHGVQAEPWSVWGTEASHSMCLVSRYWEAFADEMIRCARELGVTYFKWDAIGQYTCDAPGHEHGTEHNSREERAACYSFEQVRYMARIVDRVCAACPDAIVDFDVTEAGRCVGLAFLAAGKYFLINNGPYYRSFDDPQTAPGGGMGSNVFVFPGPARARLCRQALDYDRWIPSILFLTHYLPDDPASSQLINIGSMILGQNGIWGDLLGISEDGVGRYGHLLSAYKQVRDDVTRASPVRSGSTGGSPEFHEKIDPETGRGVVVCFAHYGAGSYTYVTARRADRAFVATEGVAVDFNAQGQAVIRFALDPPGATIVFFGCRHDV